MNIDDIKIKVEEIIIDVMDLDIEFELKDQYDNTDIEEWDSLSSMALYTRLENEFQIKLEFDDIIEMETIGDIKEVVIRKLG